MNHDDFFDNDPQFGIKPKAIATWALVALIANAVLFIGACLIVKVVFFS